MNGLSISSLQSWLATNLTPNATRGLAVLAALLTVWSWLAGHDYVVDLEARLDNATAKIEDSQYSVWEQRASEAENKLTSLRTRLWSGETAGEVRARILTSIQRAASAAALADPRIQIAEESRLLSDNLAAAGINVSGVGSIAQVLQFLTEVPKSEGMLLVTAMTLQADAPGNFSIDLAAPLSGLPPTNRGEQP